MRVQYGCLNSFIVAMVTFEELFRIMSGIWVIFEYFVSSKNDEINDILTLQCILKVYFDVFYKKNKVFSSYKCQFGNLRSLVINELRSFFLLIIS